MPRCVSLGCRRGKRNERSGENAYGFLAFFRFQVVKGKIISGVCHMAKPQGKINKIICHAHTTGVDGWSFAAPRTLKRMSGGEGGFYIVGNKKQAVGVAVKVFPSLSPHAVIWQTVDPFSPDTGHFQS